MVNTGDSAGAPRPHRPEYWSDVLVDEIRRLGFEYVAFNPGASFRGLHDSLVNFGSDGARPLMIPCLHDEHAVAIAHGYAKVTGRPMLVVLHANVGLMHATMAIFNAWCDRAPIVILGGSGPRDASQRRPWIDWLHASSDHAALVREFVKWDDEPWSDRAAVESLRLGTWQATTSPQAPVYIALDMAMQEQSATESSDTLVPRGGPGRNKPALDVADVDDLIAAVRTAACPAFIFGRGSVTDSAWSRRIELVELTGARVYCDQRAPSRFPTDHPAMVSDPTRYPDDAALDGLGQADVIVAFDPIDLDGVLEPLSQRGNGPRRVISISLDRYLERGWSKAYQRHRADVEYWVGDPDTAVDQLLAAVPERHAARGAAGPARSNPSATVTSDYCSVPMVSDALTVALDGLQPTYVRFPSAWPASGFRYTDPLSYLGSDGGAGVGSGPGIAVGAAIALRDQSRVPVAVLGDGDFIMGATALWSAIRESVGLLVVVCNNASYRNDEIHQQTLAEKRGRPVANRSIGTTIDRPVDIPALARSLGAVGYGPVTDPVDLPAVLTRAAREVLDDNHVVVVDVTISYDARLAAL